MTDWLAGLQAWLGAHPHWLGACIVLVACIECLAVAGLLVPGTVVLFALGVMAGSGALRLGETLLLAYVGGLLGDALSYGLGRRFHAQIPRLPVLRDNPQWLAAAEGFFHRHGVVSLLVGRYIGPLRPTLPLVAGMLRMPVLRFAVVSLIAASGWAVVYLAPGWVAGAALRLSLPPGFWPQLGGVAVVAAVLAVAASQLLVHEVRRAATVAGLGCLAALAALTWGWPRLHALDGGVAALLQGLHGPGWDGALVALQRLFEPTPLAAAAGLLLMALLRWGLWRAAGLAALALAGALALDLAAPLAAWGLLQRPGPAGSLHPALADGAGLPGFTVVALWLVLGVLAGRGQPPRLRLTWLLVAAAPVAVLLAGRVLVGGQWPTAMLAAALGGAAVCALATAVTEWRRELPSLGPRVGWLLLPACLALLALGAAGVID